MGPNLQRLLNRLRTSQKQKEKLYNRVFTPPGKNFGRKNSARIFTPPNKRFRQYRDISTKFSSDNSVVGRARQRARERMKKRDVRASTEFRNLFWQRGNDPASIFQRARKAKAARQGPLQVKDGTATITRIHAGTQNIPSYLRPKSMRPSRQVIPVLSGVNPFDELGYYDYSDDGLSGLWSSIKKEARRVEKKVNKARRTVYKKTLPGSVADKLIKLEKNPKIRKAVKVAALAAGAYFAAPVVAAGLKTGAAKAVGSSIAKGAIAVGKGAVGVAKFGGTLLAQQAMAAQRLPPQIMQQTEQIGQSTEFQDTYTRLRNEGYTDEQIARIWGNSSTYRNLATEGIAQTIYPEISQTYREAGIPPGIAVPAAKEEAVKIADKEVNKSGALPLALIAGLFLLS